MVWLRYFLKTIYQNDAEALLRKKDGYVSRTRMETEVRGKNKEARSAQSIILTV